MVSRKAWAALLVAFILCGQSVFGVERADVILEAQIDAQSDGNSYSAAMRGIGAFSLSMLISPLIGGGIAIGLAYATPEVQISSTRLTMAEQRYSDATLVMVYRTEYQNALTAIERTKNVRAAWAGTGVAFGVILVVILAVSA